MGLTEDLQQISDDSALLHDYVHGGDGVYVTTAGGTYPSLGESASQIQDAIDSLTALTPRGAWEALTAYAVRDIVEVDSILYVCLEAHTSGTFATDLAALRWAAYQGPSRLKASSVTYTVGSGGDFASINEALAFLSEFRPVYSTAGVIVTLSLLAGFVLNEQIICRGIDLSWIVITSVDATVAIDAGGLTDYFAFPALSSGAQYPVFAAVHGGKTPAIDTIFTFSSVVPDRIGALALGVGSEIRVIDGGFTLAYVGVACGYGGVFTANTMECDGVSISEGHYGFYAAAGGVITGDTLSAPNNETGICADRGGAVRASTITATGCYTGVFASSGDVLASSITATACSYHGLSVDSGRVQAHVINAMMGVSSAPGDIEVQHGGYISRAYGNGGSSQAIGTMTADGYISVV